MRCMIHTCFCYVKVLREGVEEQFLRGSRLFSFLSGLISCKTFARLSPSPSPSYSSPFWNDFRVVRGVIVKKSIIGRDLWTSDTFISILRAHGSWVSRARCQNSRQIPLDGFTRHCVKTHQLSKNQQQKLIKTESNMSDRKKQRKKKKEKGRERKTRIE